MFKDIIKPTLVLIIISAVVSGALAFFYNFAEIGEIGTGIEQADLDTYITTVLPDGTKLEKATTTLEEADILGIYADEGGAGCAIHLTTKGYGGEIFMLVGLDMNGAYTGAEIISSSETPGLGTQIEKPEFKQKFLGKSQSVALTQDGGDIDAFAGATVSSRAFANGVNRAFEIFPLVKEEL